MSVPRWVWVAGAGGVGWYLYQQNKVKLAANDGVTRVVNKATAGAGNIIDEASSAAGRFFGSLFGGGGSSGSSGGGNDPSYGSDTGYSYRPDQYGESAPSWGDSGFTG